MRFTTALLAVLTLSAAGAPAAAEDLAQDPVAELLRGEAENSARADRKSVV